MRTRRCPRMLSGVGAATLALTGLLAAQPVKKPAVSGTAEGPKDSQLSSYANHDGHPIRTWSGRLDNGRFTAAFVSWVDVHPSHAPQVVPLEGMIGFPEPASGNWYSNGFLNLYIGEQLVGTVPPRSVQVAETGERGRARFVWQRPEGTWTVVFIVLPNDDKVFCCVRLFPADTATPLKISLVCYPAFQTTDGHRTVTTATRTVEQVNAVPVTAASEWWYAIYDTVYDWGSRGDGGAGVLLTPETMGEVKLEVTSYPVVLTITAPPGRNEIRMLLWDSFFGMKNAEIAEYLRTKADGLLGELRGMRFEDRRLLAPDDGTEDKQIAECLAKLAQPQTQTTAAARLKQGIADLRDRLAHATGGMTPDAEDQFLSLLEARRRLVWDLKWNALLATPE